MKNSLILVLAVIFFHGTLVAQSEDSYTTEWNNSYKVISLNKDFSLKFGGRIMWDNALYFQNKDVENKYGELHNGSEFRRLRFYNTGKIYSNVNYKLQLEFSGGKVTAKDVYISFSGLGFLGKLRVGHFKEPLRLETLTSSKYITFMERSFPAGMLPVRNSGMMFSNILMNKKISWQLALFRRSNAKNNDKIVKDGYAITARVTGIVLQDKENERLIHLGLGYTIRNPKSDEISISAREESHLALKYVSTGTISNVQNISAYNLESAFVFGPFSLQSEYMNTSIKQNTLASSIYNFNSYYAQFSYFLTGESRKYKNSYSGFSRTKPLKNFNPSENGYGAWELGLRYSSINLDSKNINGGQLSDITVGLNWYLNPATRIMANYILADIKDVGKTNIFQLRFQVDF